MHVSLWFDGRRVGELTLGPCDEQGRRSGNLVPTKEYGKARPRLQCLTNGLIALDAPTPLEIRAYLTACIAALTGEGLMLQDEAGQRIPTQAIFVGDYYSPDADLAMLAHLPLLVTAQMSPEAHPEAAF